MYEVQDDKILGDMLKIYTPVKHEDDRGYFEELFNLEGMNFGMQVQQISHSVSRMGTWRGLHFQVSPYMEKAIRVVRGTISLYNVCMLPTSPNYLKSTTWTISAEHSEICWADAWVARGFYVEEDDTEVEYFQSGCYSKRGTFAVNAFDERLNLDIPTPLYISDQDRDAMSVDEFEQQWRQTLL